MAFGSFEQGSSAPMADINTTPLVDVMLVLLVVFIITTPLLSNSIPLNLPQAQTSSETREQTPIRVAIDASGKQFWNDTPITPEQLNARFRAAAKANPQIELHLFADKNVRYEQVAQTLASAQQSGISKIGFATETP
ncbi:biopolymer transporter ExbD [Neisseriaceae bacterium TC5R-5]|nr:biopolymer transporter ExbD [Neisseriaceae bacterium TC5R-5]